MSLLSFKIDCSLVVLPLLTSYYYWCKLKKSCNNYFKVLKYTKCMADK